MSQSESLLASEKLARLKTDFDVGVLADWGHEKTNVIGELKNGTWSVLELERLHSAISLLAGAMGGGENFTRNLGGVTVKKANIGFRGGEALSHRVSFSGSTVFNGKTLFNHKGHKGHDTCTARKCW